MSAEIIELGHPKRTSTVRLPKQKSVRANTADGGTPGDPIFAAIEKHRIAVQAIDDWPGDPLPKELLDRSSWPPRLLISRIQSRIYVIPNSRCRFTVERRQSVRPAFN